MPKKVRNRVSATAFTFKTPNLRCELHFCFRCYIIIIIGVQKINNFFLSNYSF